MSLRTMLLVVSTAISGCASAPEVTTDLHFRCDGVTPRCAVKDRPDGIIVELKWEL